MNSPYCHSPTLWSKADHMELCRGHAWIVREDSGCLGSANLEVLKPGMGDEDSRPDGGIYIGIILGYWKRKWKLV